MAAHEASSQLSAPILSDVFVPVVNRSVYCVNVVTDFVIQNVSHSCNAKEVFVTPTPGRRSRCCPHKAKPSLAMTSTSGSMNPATQPSDTFCPDPKPFGDVCLVVAQNG